MPVIPAPWRWRQKQEDEEFKSSMNYIVTLSQKKEKS
jgi:hypothetical protein